MRLEDIEIFGAMASHAPTTHRAAGSHFTLPWPSPAWATVKRRIDYSIIPCDSHMYYETLHLDMTRLPICPNLHKPAVVRKHFYLSVRDRCWASMLDVPRAQWRPHPQYAELDSRSDHNT